MPGFTRRIPLSGPAMGQVTEISDAQVVLDRGPDAHSRTGTGSIRIVHAIADKPGVVLGMADKQGRELPVCHRPLHDGSEVRRELGLLERPRKRSEDLMHRSTL